MYKRKGKGEMATNRTNRKKGEPTINVQTKRKRGNGLLHAVNKTQKTTHCAMNGDRKEMKRKKIIYPFAIVALVLAGMPFVFGSSRQHNLGFRLFIGMTLGGLFMLVNGSVQNLATAYSLPVALSAALPSAILMLAAFTFLRRAV